MLKYCSWWKLTIRKVKSSIVFFTSRSFGKKEEHTTITQICICMLITYYTVENYLYNARDDNNICKHVLESYIIYLKKLIQRCWIRVENVKGGGRVGTFATFYGKGLDWFKNCFMGFSYYKSNVSQGLVTSTMIFLDGLQTTKKKDYVVIRVPPKNRGDPRFSLRISSSCFW
jgi:hypothetical protein